MNKKILQLFWSFFKIGAMTFGGGYAMIPIMQHEIVETHKFVDQEEILDIVAISESTPGALAVNAATFIGYRIGGFWGSALATLGVVLPSFLIITIISGFFMAFRDNQYVAKAFMGIRAGIVILIVNAARKLYKSCEKSYFTYIMLIATVIIMLTLDPSVLIVLLCSMIIGVIYKSIMQKRAKI